MLFYPVLLAPQESGGYVVSFRDIPEALTQGETHEEAMEMAEDALLTALEFYQDDKRPIALPTPTQHGEDFLPLSTIVEAKVRLHNLMVEMDVIPAELARRMEVSPTTVSSLLNFKRGTSMAVLEDAFSALHALISLTIDK